MKLWLFACLVACFVGAWMPETHAQGAFEDCCLGYQPRIRWNILRHARSYHRQEVSGSCNLRAVIFYFRQKVVCGNPEDMDVKRAMRALSSRKKPVHSHRKSISDSQTDRKKSNHMKSKVENPNRTSIRNATLHHSRMMSRKTDN